MNLAVTIQPTTECKCGSGERQDLRGRLGAHTDSGLYPGILARNKGVLGQKKKKVTGLNLHFRKIC